MIGIGAIAKFADSALGVIKDYFPPSMSEEKKSELAMKLKEQAYQEELRQQEFLLKEREQFSERIKELEGTGADLKSVPVVGPLILLLRGAQRPVWGFATIGLNYYYFFGGMAMTDSQENLVYTITLLVGSFLFGERSIKNVAPILGRAFGKNEGAK